MYTTEAGRGDPLRTRDCGRVLIGVTGWPLRLSDLGRRDSFPLDGGLEKPSNASSKLSCKGLTGGKGSAFNTAKGMVSTGGAYISESAPAEEPGVIDERGGSLLILKRTYK